MFRKKKEKEPCLHNWKLVTKTYGKKTVIVDEDKNDRNFAGCSEQFSHKSTTTFSKTTFLYLCQICGEFRKIELAGEEIKS